MGGGTQAAAVLPNDGLLAFVDESQSLGTSQEGMPFDFGVAKLALPVKASLDTPTENFFLLDFRRNTRRTAIAPLNAPYHVVA